jgi:putative ABC transport system ATP-binding protein
VFQDFCLFSGLSVLENVSLLVPPAQRDACSDMVKAVGLGHRESVLAGYLSGGERQRVAIARAMVKRPSLLVADEPTAQLDRRTAGQVMDLFFKLGNTYSTAIVLVTHDPQVAKRCDTTVMMGTD